MLKVHFLYALMPRGSMVCRRRPLVADFLYCSGFPLPASVMYNLDEEESQGGIAVNLLPLLARDLSHKADKRSQVNDTAGKRSVPVSSRKPLQALILKMIQRCV